MFSIVFPGQGSQKIGMVKEFYEKFDLSKQIFKDADEILNVPITKIIFEGPDNKLNLTENTQPAIFLASYCIFQIIKKEFGYDFKKFKYFAGHSLGEYSALACSGSLNFSQTIKLLQSRGKFMQSAVAKGQGGMLAVLGSDVEKIKDIINKNKYPEMDKIEFKTIWDKIAEIIVSETNPIGIVQINSLSDDVLDYDRHKKGWNVIVVGGAAISRGITLEGLTVSYFTRIAKIPTLDTLVQMGRWFGYRKGYEDLFRVYVPKTLHILFRQFSFTIERAREK